MNAARRRTAAALLCALLAACATQPPDEDIADRDAAAPVLSEGERWTRHRADIAAMGDWEARGKVAFTLPDDAGTASLLWRQAQDASRLRLSGPLGANATVLSSDGALIRLRRDGIDRIYPADAAPWLGDGRLLPIPVASIQHWLRGIPNPARPVTVLETRDGLARRMEQDNWRIRYEDYREEAGQTLPARLTVVAEDVSLELRVLLRAWTLD